MQEACAAVFQEAASFEETEYEPDEALNLRLFVEAMKIYACAIVALNDVEL